MTRIPKEPTWETPWKIYLANLEKFLHTHSLRQIRKMSRSHQNRVAWWRGHIPGFKMQEEKLLEIKIRVEKEWTKAEKDAHVRFPVRFRIYIDRLRESDDRLAACKDAGLSWADVKLGLKDHEGFREAYELWQDEQNIRLEDAQAREGLGGNSAAARAVLQARDPRYRGKAVAPNLGDEPASEADRFFDNMAPAKRRDDETEDQATDA